MLDSRPSPNALTSLPDILAALSALEDEETQVSSSLSAMLSSKDAIDEALARLRSLEPQLNALQTESTLLISKVSSTAETAKRVGGRVRLLDEEMRRVREAAERVGQVVELKV